LSLKCDFLVSDFAFKLNVHRYSTEPPVNVVGGYEGKELDYEEMDDEHRRLLVGTPCKLNAADP
jgi:hypothetical protein